MFSALSTSHTDVRIFLQIRFALSDEEAFGLQNRSKFDLRTFYKSLVDYLEDPNDGGVGKALIEWWNR